MLVKKKKSATRINKAAITAKSILTYRKRYCRFCVAKTDHIDYKDKSLEKLVSERGKILSRRFTGTCVKHQRLVAEAIKKARFVALLPYIKV